MKKVYLTAFFVLSLSIILLGCNKETAEKRENFGIEKTQRIEIFSVESPESVLSTIDNQDEINEFINKLMIHKWSNGVIPSNVTKSRIYKLYQEDTVKLGEKKTKEKKLKQIATITTYKDIPYISFQTMKLNFIFKVPKDVEKYLLDR